MSKVKYYLTNNKNIVRDKPNNDGHKTIIVHEHNPYIIQSPKMYTNISLKQSIDYYETMVNTLMISSINMLELCADKVEYLYHMSKIDLVPTFRKIIYSTEMKYEDSEFILPNINVEYVNDVINMFNSKVIGIRKRHCGDIINIEIINGRVTNSHILNNYDSVMIAGIKRFALDVYREMIILSLARQKQRDNARIAAQKIITFLDKNITLLNNEEKDKIMFKLSTFNDMIRIGMCDQIFRKYRISHENINELRLSLSDYNERILGMKHNIYEDNNFEKYMMISIAMPDNNNYHDMALWNVKPFFDDGNIDNVDRIINFE